MLHFMSGSIFEANLFCFKSLQSVGINILFHVLVLLVF